MLEKNNDFLQRFEEWEAKCIEHTKKQFQNEMIRFKRSSNTLYYAFSSILRPELHQDPRKRAIMFLTPKLIFSFKAIRDLTLKGYYFETSLLERDVIECLGLCSLFARDKDKASKWMKGEDLEISKRQISNEIAVFFKSASNDRVNLKKIYDYLSRYVHYDLKAVISFVPYKGKRKVAFQRLPVFEKEKANHFSIYPLLLSTILWVVFEDELGEELRKEMQDFFFEVAQEMRKKEN